MSTAVNTPVSDPPARVPWRRRPPAEAVASPAVVVAGCLVVLLLAWYGFTPYYLYLTVLTAFACIGATGLNLQMGYAGLVSIGNAGFMAVGAFTAVWADHYGGLLVGVLAGGVAAGLVGLFVGVVSMRLRGFYLVLSTLALQFVAAFAGQQIEQALNEPAGFILPVPSVGPWQLASDRAWLTFALVLLAIELIVVHLIMRGRLGRAFLAIREHENAAGVVGVNVALTKMLASGISAAMIGVGGAALAYYIGNVDYSTYTLDLAVSYAAMVLIGGLGSAYGPLLGAALVTLLPALLSALDSGSSAGYFTQHSSSVDLLVYGLLIIAIVLAEPGGLAVLLRRLAAFVGRRLSRIVPGSGS
ncbi:MAG TPA: branched-chain amino acid ABC transporter permease [Trebonia sp.]|nr:branched-chain amino acid ABC transporter permease [Trebonia sp.]